MGRLGKSEKATDGHRPCRAASALWDTVQHRSGRSDSDRGKGYYLRSFEDAFSRYLPYSRGFNPCTPCTNPGNTGESEDFADVHKFSLCTGRKMPETPAIPGFVHGVTG